MPLGYPLPKPVDNGDTICVRVDVPNVPEHRRAFISAVKSLTEWFSWQRDDGKSGKDAAAVWRPVLDSVIDQLSGDTDCTDCEKNPCKDYAPDHPLIRYYPNDPFRTPNFVPENYTLPPFYHNALIALPGVLPSDAMVNFAATIFSNLWDTVQILLGNPGLPHAKMTVLGSGEMEIEFVKIQQGGLAVIVVDEDYGNVKVVELASNENIDLEDFIELFNGTVAEVVKTSVFEIKIPTEGQHEILVLFTPNIGQGIVFGFGGGIRRVTLCKGLSVAGSPDMFKLRQNAADNCLLEQSLDGGTTWQTAFDYGLCQQSNVTKIYRYTTVNNSTVYQESTDGGTTWLPAPVQSDPRNYAGTLPPLTGDARCDAACSATTVIQAEVQGTIDHLNGSGTQAGLAAAVLAFLEFIGIVAPGIGVVVAALVAAAYAYGASTFSAAFSDSTIWDKLRCHLYKNVANDGSFGISAWNAVKDQLGDDLSGIVRDHLWRVIDLMGAAGLTNAARLGQGDGCSDCADCNNEWCHTETITPNPDVDFYLPLTAHVLGFSFLLNGQAEGAVSGIYPSGSVTGGEIVGSLYKKFCDVPNCEGFYWHTTIGSVPVLEVTVWGVGTNPYGTNNCP